MSSGRHSSSDVTSCDKPDLKMMRPEDRFLLKCARQEFTDQHRKTVLDICESTEIDWQAVYSTSESHQVAPLVYKNLLERDAAALCVPRNVLNAFEMSYARNVVVKEIMAGRTAEALSFLNSMAIDAMVIKGAALDILINGHPGHVVSRDVDLVFRRRRSELSGEEIDHIASRLDGQGIEWDCFEHHDIVINGVLPVDFGRIWDDAIQIEFRGERVYVMSPEDTLISACINSCRKRYFRVRTLYEIAEIINVYPNMDWEHLLQKAKAYDCCNIVYAALLVTGATIGCGLPGGLLDRLGVHPVRAAMIRSLVRFLSQSKCLSSLRDGPMLLGRPYNLSLILPYATYRRYQLGRKLKYVYGSRRGMQQ